MSESSFAVSSYAARLLLPPSQCQSENTIASFLRAQRETCALTEPKLEPHDTCPGNNLLKDEYMKSGIPRPEIATFTHPLMNLPNPLLFLGVAHPSHYGGLDSLPPEFPPVASSGGDNSKHHNEAVTLESVDRPVNFESCAGKVSLLHYVRRMCPCDLKRNLPDNHRSRASFSVNLVHEATDPITSDPNGVGTDGSGFRGDSWWRNAFLDFLLPHDYCLGMYG